MNNYQIPNQIYNNPYSQYNQNGDRLLGGFAFPFLLGGVTGAAIAPAFWNNGYGRPYYGNYYYYPYPYYYR